MRLCGCGRVSLRKDIEELGGNLSGGLADEEGALISCPEKEVSTHKVVWGLPEATSVPWGGSGRGRERMGWDRALTVPHLSSF